MKLLTLLGCICCFLGVSAFAQESPHTARNQTAANRGAMLFKQNCSACHGTDGRGGERAPDIATQREIVSLSDIQLSTIISKGIVAAGMPGFAYLGRNNIHDLVSHLRVLQGIEGTKNVPLPGDPVVGESIFFRSGSCSECHSIHGRGGFMGDDLTGYARGRTAKSIRDAIVHPGNGPAGPGRLITVETANGATYTGLVRAQDNFNLVLQSEDGAFHSIARAAIGHIDDSGRSLMPQDYGRKFDSKQIDDLIGYLMKTARAEGTEQKAAKSLKRSEADRSPR